MTASAKTVLASLLLNSRVGWSIGRNGAIAEFYRDEREQTCTDGPLSIATARGALSVSADHADAGLFAGETLGHGGQGWSQWLSLCLPKAQALTRGGDVVMEVGRDGSAIDPGCRADHLFDLGIGGPYFRLCVRTGSEALLRELRAAAGCALRNVPALIRALVELSPTRVFESRLARIEVAQAIAPVDGRSPEGPHTHFLPHLIQGDGADSPSAPHGWVAQIVAYPSNPLRDVHGHDKPFDIDEHQAFQHWLESFGDAGHRSVKRKVFDAVRAGRSPGALAIDRAEQDSARVALRQLRYVDGDSPALAQWRAAYDSL